MTRVLIFYAVFSLHGGIPDFWSLEVMSWYGEPFHGRTTASGSVYDMNQLTVAHRTLPFGKVVEFFCEDGSREWIPAVVTDRGPFVDGRSWDASRELFRRLSGNRLDRGLIRVRCRIRVEPITTPVRMSGAVGRRDKQGAPCAPGEDGERESGSGGADSEGVGSLVVRWLSAVFGDSTAEGIGAAITNTEVVARRSVTGWARFIAGLALEQEK